MGELAIGFFLRPFLRIQCTRDHHREVHPLAFTAPYSPRSALLSMLLDAP